MWGKERSRQGRYHIFPLDSPFFVSYTPVRNVSPSCPDILSLFLGLMASFKTKKPGFESLIVTQYHFYFWVIRKEIGPPDRVVGAFCGWLVTRDSGAARVVCRCHSFYNLYFVWRLTEARTVSWIVFIICCATRNVMAAPVRQKSEISPAIDDESATDHIEHLQSGKFQLSFWFVKLQILIS